MQERGLVSVGSWVAIVFTVWVIAWIIAESIPVFNNLLGFIVRFPSPTMLNIELITLQAALFASWFTCKSLTHSTSIIETNNIDRRLEWRFLALHELGPVLLLSKEDPPYSRQCDDFRHCRLCCMSSLFHLWGVVS